MKKFLLILSAFALFVGCQKAENLAPTEENQVVFRAYTESSTKATLDDLDFLWDKGDKIGVWATKAEKKQLYSYENKDIAAATGTFTGTQGADTYDFAVFPLSDFGIYDNYFFKLPNTFANYKSGQVVSPMISLIGEYADGYTNLNFKHLCGMIKLSITDLPAGTTSVSWTNDGYYPINGQCDIIASKLNEAELLAAVDVMSAVSNGTASKTTTFSFPALETRGDMLIYVPLLPGTYETGFTIKASNGVDEIVLGKSTKSQTVGRAKVHKLNVNASAKDYPVKIIDVLDYDSLLPSGSGYQDFSWTSANTVTYKGNAYFGTKNYIQIKNGSSSGIVSTSSIGVANKISAAWGSTGSGKIISIYGKNTAYSSAADLYTESTRGTLLGTISHGTSAPLDLSATPYNYIGIVSDGAVQMSSITIEWGEDTRTPLAASTEVIAEVNASIPNQIDVIWEEVSGATNYEVSIYKTSDTSTAVETKTVEDDTYCSFTGLDGETDYIVKVIALPSNPGLNTPSPAAESDTVTTGAVEAPKTVTIEVSSFSSTLGIINEVISYTTAQGGGTTAPAINGGQIRLYQKGSGKAYGGYITVSAESGYTITSVTIGSAMATTIAYTVDADTTLSSSSSLAANSKKTYDLASGASSVSIYCLGNSASSRLYVNYLSVTYEAE